MVMLSAALVEERLMRRISKERDYRLSIGLMKTLTDIALLVTIYEVFNFSFRLYHGLPGSTVEGAEANSVVSLLGLALYFALAMLLGRSLLHLLRQAARPDLDERERQRRMAAVRLKAERRRSDGGHRELG